MWYTWGLELGCVFYEGTLQLGTNCALAVVSCEISIVLVFGISVGAWYSAMQA